MIIELGILSLAFLLVGGILGFQLGRSNGPKIETPEWLNNLRSILGRETWH